MQCPLKKGHRSGFCMCKDAFIIIAILFVGNWCFYSLGYGRLGLFFLVGRNILFFIIYNFTFGPVEKKKKPISWKWQKKCIEKSSTEKNEKHWIIFFNLKAYFKMLPRSNPQLNSFRDFKFSRRIW